MGINVNNFSSDQIEEMRNLVVKYFNDQIEHEKSNIRCLPDDIRIKMEGRSLDLKNIIGEVNVVFSCIFSDVVKNEKYSVYEDEDIHYDLKTLFLTKGNRAIFEYLLYVNGDKNKMRTFDEIDDEINKFRHSDAVVFKNNDYRVDFSREKTYLTSEQWLDLSMYVSDLKENIEDITYKFRFKIEDSIYGAEKELSEDYKTIGIHNLKNNINNYLRSTLWFLTKEKQL